MSEAKELTEKGFLTSSCCPAFVHYVKSEFPDLAEHISHNLSPMVEISKYIKKTDPGAKAIFIEAQTYALDFYKKFGFEPCGEEFLEDGIPHTPMTLTF